MKQIALILLILSSSFGSLATSLVPMADELIALLKNRQTEIKIIPNDGRYTIDLEPLFHELSRSIAHRSPKITLNRHVSSEYQLTASYYFNPSNRSLQVKCYLFQNDAILYESRKIDITSSLATAIPNHRTIFNGSIEEEQLLFRATIQDRINRVIVENELPNLLVRHHRFRVEGEQGTRLSWDEQIVLNWLNTQFGIAIDTRSPYTIRFTSDGSLTVTDGFITETIPHLLPQTVSSAPSVGYLTAVPTNRGHDFQRVTPEMPVENHIISEIKTFFSRYYPTYFSHFSADALRDLFANPNAKTVLTGSLHTQSSVTYQWLTPNQWVDGLQRLSQAGRQFNVSCNVKEIVQDPLSPYRFWAVVDQQWKTLDQNGIERYEDNGYLLVNFDFTANGELLDITFHYRLWFYSYPFEIQRDRSVTRQQKIQRDIQFGFNGINGIDSTLELKIKETLLQAF